MNELNALGEIIFLERYAKKDLERNYEIGDTVVFKEGYQKKSGTVTALRENGVEILSDGETFIRNGLEVDRVIETKPEQMFQRVASAVASVEADKEYWTQKFVDVMTNWKFIPGGRILAGMGVDGLSAYNCFVIPSPKDSRSGIMDTLGQMIEIMSRGGGVGINLSTLRPKYAVVKGVNGRSSGAVSWGGIYSYATGLVEQGGSRRGALMLMLADWHPDIEEFIDAKREAGKITNANISVTLSDKFMQAVDEDKDWVLAFPDTTHPAYATEWDGDLEKWLEKGYTTNLYKMVKARELYRKIVESAWASAEPGIWFIDRANAMSNSWYFDRLIATNPCGEQGLPGFGVCNLGAINLAKYVNQDGVMWDDLYNDVQTVVRFLDNVIDATPYFFDQNEVQQKKERRVGLNTMGLAEMLIKLGLRYGSDGSINFINKLYKHIVKAAYMASASIAQEKGSFPAFDFDKFMDSGFMQNMVKEIPELLYSIKSFGMRNVTLLTQAPNGSTGTMVDTSTGIEPFFAFEFQRTSRLGKYTQRVKVLEDWMKANPNKEIPEYFVTAMQLTPREHVEVLGAIQYWIDSAISKTANLPSDYTVDQVGELYELMYKLGAKGGTVYRDKSRDTQVLEVVEDKGLSHTTYPLVIDDPQKALNTEKEIQEKAEQWWNDTMNKRVKANTEPTIVLSKLNGQDLPEGDTITLTAKGVSTINVRTGQTISLPTAFGTLHLTCNFDENDEPVEVFINVGKAGSDLMAIAEGVGRLISFALQIPSSQSRESRYTEIISQLRGIGGNSVYGFGPNKITSFPDAVSKAMTFDAVKQDKVTKNKVSYDLCPECGSASLIKEEACSKCMNCGYSKC